MKPANRQQFKVKSYVKNWYGRDLRERPPRSAKLVADLDLGSSPGSGDFRIYLLSTNHERSLWILWMKLENPADYKPPFLYYRIATGRPYRGYAPRFAAEQLLVKAWQDQRDIAGWRPPEALVLNAGVLTQHDICRIKLAVFGEYPGARVPSVEAPKAQELLRSIQEAIRKFAHVSLAR